MSILAASVTACPDPSGKQVVLYGQTLIKIRHADTQYFYSIIHK
jgi:hypothetical protein